MFFDSHAHLNFKPFQKDYPRVIERCFENNVWLVNVGSQYETNQRAIEIASEYKKGVWAAVGLHPIYVEDEIFNYQKYLELAKNPMIVAIGETGLDYYHITKNSKLKTKNLKQLQKEIFLKHLELAREVKKPVIIHCREAYEDLIEILKSKLKTEKQKLKGVVHCFSGNNQQAKQFLEMGFFLGFTGVITYSSSYDQLIKELPLEKILIETDCPYLAPVPYRGKRNEPVYVKYTAQKIAEIRAIPLEKVAEETFQNALKLFNLRTSDVLNIDGNNFGTSDVQ